MALDNPFDMQGRVKTGALIALLKAVSSDFQGYMRQICKEKGVDFSNYGPELDWDIELGIYSEIAKLVGPSTLHYMGRKVGEEIPLSPSIRTMEEALRVGINQAYRATHSGERIGHYRLLSFDEDAGKAILEAHNPYPGCFDSGLIFSFARRYQKPIHFNLDITTDSSKPSREAGEGYTSTYLITWDSV
ncbi:MAG TPA: hypothetical protein DCE41_17020 [Cytophagales bacterium]|nr:hypothetical protein [Cytophagales bacterium]HAA19078.1 hypothetical protein [Cytophagales bacterium]HAP64093.1 hypothetical protein [Cytophagales bacterium]